MGNTHYFQYGWITPALSCVLSYLGAFLAATAATRIRFSRQRAVRARWLVLAALAVGGTGMWCAYFASMLGFAVDGVGLRYDPLIISAAGVIGTLIGGLGLVVAGYGRPRVVKALPAGLLLGLAVIGTQQVAALGMRMNGSLAYDQRLVIGSAAVAVVLSATGLAVMIGVPGRWGLLISAAVLAAAIAGSHLTTLLSMRVQPRPDQVDSAGVDRMVLLLPIMVLLLFGVLALFYALLAVPTRRDRMLQEELRARMAAPIGLRQPPGRGASTAGGPYGR